MRRAFVFRAGLALLAGLVLAGPGAGMVLAAHIKGNHKAAVRMEEGIPGTNLFKPAPLRKLRVEITAAELAKLRQDNRRYVRGNFYDGDKLIPDVGVHLKGAAGSMRGLDDRPALTVHFDKFVPDQKWEGLDKVHLNNSVQDGSYLTENLCGELFRQAGVPAARACNARVELNHRDLGVYVLKEGFTKTFLRQYYHNVKGNLYDGGFCRDITEPLDRMSGSDSTDQPEVKALVSAAKDQDLKRRFQKLEGLLDMDRFLSFCALEVMTWDWDGYVLKPNNYRLYWDPETRKITFFPHGMDQMFWEPQGPVEPGINGLMARALIETPEGRKRYLERMTELTTNLFHASSITNRMIAYGACIRASLAEKDPNAAREYDNQLNRLRDLIVGREAYLRQQLISAKPK